MQIEQTFVTRENAVDVKSDVLKAFASGDTELDFVNVRTVDSSAVSLMMSCVRHSEKHTISVRNAPEKLLDLLKLYGVYDSLKSFIHEGLDKRGSL